MPFDCSCKLEVRLLICNIGRPIEKHSSFTEGLVKLSSPTDDDYHYYEKECVIKVSCHSRKFRRGDNQQVKVVRINAFRSAIDFPLV